MEQAVTDREYRFRIVYNFDITRMLLKRGYSPNVEINRNDENKMVFKFPSTTEFEEAFKECKELYISSKNQQL